MNKKPRLHTKIYSLLLHCFTPCKTAFQIVGPYKYVFDSSAAKYIPTLGGTLQFCRVFAHCEFVQLAS